MKDNLHNRIQMLESVIRNRTQDLEKKKEEFNYHNREVNRLQYVCEKLAVENMKDKERLNELKETINANPILSRQ